MATCYPNHKPYHDDVIKWKHFQRYWSFLRGIHRSPGNSSHKGQWRGALMFPLICAWINGWVNNREAEDLRHHRAHYNVSVMSSKVYPLCQCLSDFSDHNSWVGDIKVVSLIVLPNHSGPNSPKQCDQMWNSVQHLSSAAETASPFIQIPVFYIEYLPYEQVFILLCFVAILYHQTAIDSRDWFTHVFQGSFIDTAVYEIHLKKYG